MTRFFLFGFFSIVFLAGCGNWQRGPEAVDEWLVNYQVERQQHYPVATDVSLYLKGDDEQILTSFESSLNSHFQHVSIPETLDGITNSGFVLELDKDPDAKRLLIRITDLSSQKTFDRVKIEFDNPKSLAGDTSTGKHNLSLQRALNVAAAKIAGNG